MSDLSLKEAAQQALRNLELCYLDETHPNYEFEYAARAVLFDALEQDEQDWSLLSVTQESLREHMAELKKVSEERDELLNVLETLVEHFEYYMGDNECRPLENARAAIARATEGGNNE